MTGMLDNLSAATVSSAVACVLVFATVAVRGRTRRSPRRKALKHSADEPFVLPREPVHSYQRKAAIAAGGAVDHAGEVVLTSMEDFDIRQTIFASVNSKLKQLVLSARLANEVYWHEHGAAAIDKSFAEFQRLHPPPAPDTAVLDFMETECNFKCEHADGTFMDHLYFCQDYGAAHFSQHSPRVLLLHSIMGVGTNLFPMSVDKIPKLEALVTPFEMRHIEAFPSMLRLLYEGSILTELRQAGVARLSGLQRVTFHRVLDNKEVCLSAEDFWIQLNYQLVHLLDFLPVANWGAQLDDSLFHKFIDLHEFLTQAKKVQAKVDFDLANPGECTDDGLPMTLGGLINKAMPSSIKKRLARDEIVRFSRECGHSLNFKIEWA